MTKYTICTVLAIVIIPLTSFAADSIGTYKDEKGRTVYTNIKEQPPASTPRQASTPHPSSSRGPEKDATPRISMPQVSQKPAPVRRMASILNDIYESLSLYVFIVVILPGIVWIICLVDILTSEFTGSNKIKWLFVSLLLPYIGPLLYYFIGLNQKKSPDLHEQFHR